MTILLLLGRLQAMLQHDRPLNNTWFTARARAAMLRIGHDKDLIVASSGRHPGDEGRT
jgi:hypothetical protein